MIINTTDKTATFDTPVTLTVKQLTALVDLLQDWHPCTPDEALAALRDKLAEPKPVSTKTIVSFTDPYVEYTLSVFGDGHVECSCPHFQIRGFANGTLLKDFRCKHIRVYFPGV